MNMHLEAYLAGTPYHTRTANIKGRRVPVFDHTVRWRATARALQARGAHAVTIACAVGKPSAVVRRVTSFAWRF